MKLAYCIPSLYISGGMERVVTIKANYFADILGYEVYIILTDGKDKSPYFKLSSNIKVVNLDINYDETFGKRFIKRVTNYLRKQKLYKKKLKKCLCDVKPDITISMLRREIVFINSIRDGSIKIGEVHMNRLNMHNAFGQDLNIIKRIVAKLWMHQLIVSLKKLSQFVVLTNEDLKNWPELNNVTVIPNPLPFFPKITSDSTEKQAIAVGRYRPEKGFNLLIDAWRIVVERHPDWVLRIYGEGGMRHELQRQVQKLSLEDRCILEPPVSDISLPYIASSIFVLSSLFEGFGMVIAEAMSCGVPAVSFDCPCGPKDLIMDGEDGILVENGNIQALAKKICFLIENEVLRKEMGRQARYNIQRLKIDKVAEQWRTLFESSMKKRNDYNINPISPIFSGTNGN